MASIRKRTWSTAKGERSAWIVAYRYKGADGKRKQHIKTFDTKKAAVEWRASMTVEVGKGIHTRRPASRLPMPASGGSIRRSTTGWNGQRPPATASS
jgi:hypothetical protein